MNDVDARHIELLFQNGFIIFFTICNVNYIFVNILRVELDYYYYFLVDTFKVNKY